MTQSLSKAPVLTRDEKHIYRLDGVVIPGVSQIIREAGMSSFPESGGSWQSQRGQAVHLACQLWDEADLDEATLDPAIAPYLEAWKNFLAENKAKVLMNEQMLYHPTLRYAGTIDRLLLIGEQEFLCDIKTGSKYPEYPIQTAGYALLIDRPVGRMCVYLAGNGTFNTSTHRDRSDEQYFLAAYTISNWHRNGGGE